MFYVLVKKYMADLESKKLLPIIIAIEVRALIFTWYLFLRGEKIIRETIYSHARGISI